MASRTMQSSKTVNWAEGWFTTTLDEKQAEKEVKQKYPNAHMVPLGVQSLAWPSYREFVEDEERTRYIASII
jgi:hypothetical protein